MYREALVGLVFVFASVAAAIAQPPLSDVEAALGTIFSPLRAPSEKKMGLLQRSFLDLVESSKPRLEIALVIDGTRSMGNELQGIQRTLAQMADDLRRHKQDNVFFQLVVFRDAGSADGEILFPLALSNHSFTNNLESLDAAIKGIQQDSGAPYFPELVDLGVFEALTKLDWSSDENTTRWILLFGDAPPFEEGFAEDNTRARRRISTSQLIATASRKDIHINCILCRSGPQDSAAFDQALEVTRTFFNELATQTEGLMLDLSFSDIRDAVRQAAAPETVYYQRIGKITQEDIDAERERAAKENELLLEDRRLKAAILPHMPLDRISFDPARDEVQYAAELRLRLRSVPGADLKNPRLIEQQLEILRARGVRGDSLLQLLGAALNVDYIVWGSFARTENALEVETSFYNVTDGKVVVGERLRTSESLPITQLCGQMAANVMTRTASGRVDERLALAFNRLPPAQRTVVIVPVAHGENARTKLLAGLEALEQALAYNSGDEPAQRLLQKARATLEEAVLEETTNPVAYWLLANCYFNLSQSPQVRQRGGEAERLRASYSAALNNAYRFRGETDIAHIKREIEADYALLYSKDYPQAIKIYEDLAQAKAGASLPSALRAHWMLAGIYGGDWGIANDAQHLINAQLARQHLIQILAHWRDSNEAAFIRKNLRWDETSAENKHEHFPGIGRLQAPKEA